MAGRNIHRLAVAAMVVVFGFLAPTGPKAQTLVADLSSHLVSVTTGFAGTDLLLFGAVADEGDVVVVVRGPDKIGRASCRERV